MPKERKTEIMQALDKLPEEFQQNIKDTTINPALNRQVGGDHYIKMAIQPAEFCLENLNRDELIGVLKWMVTKYVWRNKNNQQEDFAKAAQYIELITIKLKTMPVDKSDQLWDFPITKFAQNKDSRLQLKGMASEARKFLAEYRKFVDDEKDVNMELLNEATDFVHSYHTFAHQSEENMEMVKRSKQQVIKKNRVRGYY